MVTEEAESQQVSKYVQRGTPSCWEVLASVPQGTGIDPSTRPYVITADNSHPQHQGLWQKINCGNPKHPETVTTATLKPGVV